MGSPQKKNIGQLLESPYARHLPQYPSQSEGFVPNEFGGKTPSKQHFHGNNYHQNNSNQRRRGNNRYFNAQRGPGGGGNNIGGGGGNYGGGGGGGYRQQNSFQNNYNEHQGNRYSNSGNRQQPYHGQKYNKSDGNSRNDYYHPSMLADPWKDLLERHNAIKNSQITIPSTATNDSDDEPIATTSSPDSSAIPDDSSERSGSSQPTPGTSTSTPT